jgi:hypothetical protein
MSRNGKGDRNRSVPKTFRAGYDGINWAKKPAKPRGWVCAHCDQPISDADFTGMRAFVAYTPSMTPVVMHYTCAN